MAAPPPAILATAPEPGSFLGLAGQMLGKYRVLHLLGHGGSSAVCRAEDTVLLRVVALKVLSPALMDDPTFLPRFEREAQAIGRLSHPNLVAIYETGEPQGRLFYAMEWLPGGDLKFWILAKGRLTVDETTAWALPILEALAYAHEHGIVHRGIKPSSILFDAAGKPVLTDFALAEVFVGTPLYSAPEQWQGGSVDARTDLYAFGVVLFECLTGQPPFSGTDAAAIGAQQTGSPPPRLRDLNPDLPQAMEDLVLKLLEKDPARRCQTAAEVAQALRQVVGQTPERSPGP